jgi:hypothetical protein
MTVILDGTIREVLKEIFARDIPMNTKVHVELETSAVDIHLGPKITPEEMKHNLQRLAEIGAKVPYDPTITYSREDIYFDYFNHD